MTDGVKKAMEKFYASKKAQELPKVKKKKSKSTELTEEQIQNRVVTAMRKLGLFVFHTPLNAGGRADAIQASRYKRMGALRGTPDLVVLDAPVEYKGVFWEIKSRRAGFHRNKLILWKRRQLWVGSAFAARDSSLT